MNPARRTTSSNPPGLAPGTGGVLPGAPEFAGGAPSALRNGSARSDHLNRILSCVSDQVIMLDSDGRCVFVNERVTEVTGQAAGELLGRIVWELFPGKPGSQFEQEVRRSMRESVPVHFECHSPERDRWYEHHVYPSEEGCFILVADITDRKRTQQELRNREAQLQFISNSTPVALAHCSADGRFRFVNRAYANRHGLEPSDIHGRRIVDVLGEPAFERLRPYIEQVLAGKTVHYELELPYRDLGKRVMAVSYVPEKDAGGAVHGWLCSVRDVTEERRMVAELRRSQSHFELALEAGHCGACEWNLATNVLTWSREHFRIFGYEPFSFEPAHEHWWQRIHPDDRRFVSTELEAARNEHRGAVIEHRIALPDGSIRWVTSRGRFQYDTEGRAVSLHGIVTDITHRKHAEKVLRESEERLRLATQAGRIGIWDWDIGANRVSWTDSLYTIHGISRSEFNGKVEGFAALVHPGDRERVSIAIQRSLKSTEPYELEFRALRPDGTTIWLFTNAVVLRDPNGQGVRMLGATVDITELKLTELALRESEQRFRTLAAHAPVGIFHTDSQGKCRLVNEAWTRLSGLTATQALDDGWAKAVHPDDCARVVAEWNDSIQHANVFTSEYRYRQPDGSSVWVSAKAVRVLDEQGRTTGFIGTVADINDRKANEAALERRVEERTASLREAVAQMEEFSYSVSHDLRAPLRAIQGYAEALLSEYSGQLDEQGREFLNRIVRNGTRMDRLILDILTYSRLSQREIHLQPVSLNRLVLELVQQYPGAKDPQPEVMIREPLHPVLGHEPSLSQAISNLLSNAAKFVAPGIVPHIEIWTEAVGTDVRLWIKDNGIGVRPEHQSRLFGMFERIHPETKYEGTGIGLAIVRKAMERMGGNVGLQSDGVNGTQFWIQLPAAEDFTYEYSESNPPPDRRQ